MKGIEENFHSLDNEVLSFLSMRKEDLMSTHVTYLKCHPELTEVLNDFLSSLLLHKPDDLHLFAKDYFSSFNKNPHKYKPLIVVGPSGVGKSTLINYIRTLFPQIFQFGISHTVRPIRAGEKEGVNYHYVDEEQFQQMIQQEDFIEYAVVHGNHYGTSKHEVQRIKEDGKICLLDIDVQGAFKVKEANIDANFMFIYPPTIEILKERLTARDTDDDETIKLRIANAVKEIETSNKTNLFKYKIVNDELETAKQELKDFVVKLYSQEIKEHELKDK